MDVILEKNVNHQIQEFVGNTSYLFTGIVCKEWIHKNKITNVNESIKSIKRLEESFDYDLPRSKICEKVAKTGSLEMLQMARKKKCLWGPGTCYFAAENGHLEVLKWARSNGCPWDEWTCSKAAENGHLEVLKWARSNGCPWDLNTCSFAADNGHLDVLNWAIDHGCPE